MENVKEWKDRATYGSVLTQCGINLPRGLEWFEKVLEILKMNHPLLYKEQSKKMENLYAVTAFSVCGMKFRLKAGCYIALCEPFFGSLKTKAYWDILTKAPLHKLDKTEDAIESFGWAQHRIDRFAQINLWALNESLGSLKGKEQSRFKMPLADELFEIWTFCLPCRYRFRCAITFSLDFLKLLSYLKLHLILASKFEPKAKITREITKEIREILTGISRYQYEIFQRIEETKIEEKECLGWPPTFDQDEAKQKVNIVRKMIQSEKCQIRGGATEFYKKSKDDILKIEPIVTSCIIEYLALNTHEYVDHIMQMEKCDKATAEKFVKGTFEKALKSLVCMYEGFTPQNTISSDSPALIDGAWLCISPSPKEPGIETDYSLLSSLDILSALNMLRICQATNNLEIMGGIEKIITEAQKQISYRVNEAITADKIEYFATNATWLDNYITHCRYSDLSGLVRMLDFILDIRLCDIITDKNLLIDELQLSGDLVVKAMFKLLKSQNDEEGFWPEVTNEYKDKYTKEQILEFFGEYIDDINISLENTLETLSVIARFTFLTSK